MSNWKQAYNIVTVLYVRQPIRLAEFKLVDSNPNSGKACYHSVQKLLSSRLLSKKHEHLNIKSIILSVVLYGCETWSLTLREKHRLRAFTTGY
jgi:hypothetical protein